MEIYTDNKQYANDTITGHADWRELQMSRLHPGLRQLCEDIFPGQDIHQATTGSIGCWRHAFLVDEAPSSHYDLMVEMSGRREELPHGIICLARSGRDFHGQRGRPWATQPGNIHLTAFLSPNRPIERFHIGFSLLASVNILLSVLITLKCATHPSPFAYPSS